MKTRSIASLLGYDMKTRSIASLLGYGSGNEAFPVAEVAQLRFEAVSTPDDYWDITHILFITLYENCYAGSFRTFDAVDADASQSRHFDFELANFPRISTNIHEVPAQDVGSEQSRQYLQTYIMDEFERHNYHIDPDHPGGVPSDDPSCIVYQKAQLEMFARTAATVIWADAFFRFSGE